MQVGPFQLKNGVYWVGDLCNVLEERDWNELRGCQGQSTLSDGRNVVLFHLPEGAGIYPSKEGKHYVVHSGTIGMTLSEGLPIDKQHSGHLVVYTNTFSCMCITVAHPQGGGDVSFNSFGENIQIDSDDQCYFNTGFLRGFANTTQRQALETILV